MAPLANVGIISIGEMGLGIARLLAAHNYQVLTNVTGRRYISVLFPKLSELTGHSLIQPAIPTVKTDIYAANSPPNVLHPRR